MFEANVVDNNEIYILHHITIFSILLVKKLDQQMTCFGLKITSVL